MVTKENSSKLLSKVAKFVRNPTTNWSDLDTIVPEAESGYTKQALKEMIERKRQNDFVRKREFDQLRKLRSRDPAARIEFAARPSFYQSSIPSNIGERAVTLKKIDEIEAQMSKQWWKGKQGDQVQQNQNGSNFPVAGAGAVQDPAKYETTQAGGGMAGAAPAGEEFAATQMGHGAVAGSVDQGPVLGPRVFDAKPSGFSTSKLFSVELSDDHTDADLEEAAIRFANGDDAGAETGLIEALRGSSGQTGPEELWIAALFDFYRATGQQAKFDSLALEFAERYGRSAPGWFSMREPSPEKLVEPDATPVSAPEVEHPIWECPASLDLAAMGQLHLALANAPMPWSLNWSGLDEIEPNALHSLGQMFATWCSQQVRLRFDGVFTLLQVLMRHTPSGNKSTNMIWWRLRMDAMRIMRMHDDFELLALDYCVTFEVSPPSWQDPRCEFQEVNRRRTGNTAPVSLHDILSESAHLGGSSHALTALIGLEDVPVVVVELAGEIAGDAADALSRLEVGRHEGAGRLVISCARLIRVDFSAAGSILNWVAQREEEGCNVQFREVHRLVGAFFNVIGINEHARVVLRSN
jgi:anti-anti-sigma regulatory factor